MMTDKRTETGLKREASRVAVLHPARPRFRPWPRRGVVLTDVHPLFLAASGVAFGFLLALEGDRACHIVPARLLPQPCIALGGIIIGAATLIAVLAAAAAVSAQAIGRVEMAWEAGDALDSFAR
ncbi:MAG: hypothetical protein OXQ84_07980 [bacterium]|nr:hypothetical protein [bacterium]